MSNHDDLARAVLGLSRDQLIVSLRFLGNALGQLSVETAASTQSFPDRDPLAEERALLATDGSALVFNAGNVLLCFKTHREQVTREFLHLILHCVLGHPFKLPAQDQDRWDLACDIAVEQIISELDPGAQLGRPHPEQAAILAALKKSLKSITAEKVFRHLTHQHVSDTLIDDWRSAFLADSHGLWGTVETSTWSEISERLEVDLDTLSQNWSSQSASLIQNIQTVNRVQEDYRKFLQRFMVLDEALQLDDSEFDLIYYTHGLNLYKNLPLIEPLEHREIYKIRDFVIAIDTSASCSGELIQAFLDRTCALFRHQESFFQTFNIHIIQCDQAVQSDTRLTNFDDFERFTRNIVVQGFGGTDFRPVFTKVAEMVEAGEFSQFKGLIYFTDGLGIFPEQKPPFEAAFVFLSDEGHAIKVPPWAIKLVLTEEDLQSWQQLEDKG